DRQPSLVLPQRDIFAADWCAANEDRVSGRRRRCGGRLCRGLHGQQRHDRPDKMKNAHHPESYQTMPAAELDRALREMAGIGAVSPRGAIAVAGPDRASYLQGLLTNDIQ